MNHIWSIYSIPCRQVKLKSGVKLSNQFCKGGTKNIKIRSPTNGGKHPFNLFPYTQYIHGKLLITFAGDNSPLITHSKQGFWDKEATAKKERELEGEKKLGKATGWAGEKPGKKKKGGLLPREKKRAWGKSEKKKKTRGRKELRAGWRRKEEGKVAENLVPGWQTSPLPD